MRDWRNEPMTPEEQDAWDEHEAYLIAQGQHDRAAYLDHKAEPYPWGEGERYFLGRDLETEVGRQDAHEMNVAICNALTNPDLTLWEKP